MTKSEFFEKNNISFAEAMKLFNKQKKFKSFDKFLASEHIELKFKVGDLIVLQLTLATKAKGWAKNVVFKIVERFDNSELFDNGAYAVEAMTPDICTEIGSRYLFDCRFCEDNCVLY